MERPPAVHLAQSLPSNHVLQTKHCQGKEEREKDPVLETFPEKKQEPKYSLWNQNMSSLHFFSYPRRKRDGCVVLWGGQEKFRQLWLGTLGAREMWYRGSGWTPKSANNTAWSGRSSTQIPSSRSFCYHTSLLLYFPRVHMDYRHMPPRKENSKRNFFPWRTTRHPKYHFPTSHYHLPSAFSPHEHWALILWDTTFTFTEGMLEPLSLLRGIRVPYICPLVTPFVHLPRKISDHQCFSKLGIAQTLLVLIKV